MKLKNTALIYTAILAIFGGIIVAATNYGLSKTDQIKTIWTKFEQHRSEKAVVLSRLRAELGFGGMIHNYKNFVLRRDPKDRDIATRYLGAVQAEIENYNGLQLNTSEQVSLRTIKETLNLYLEAINKIDSEILSNKSSKIIDSLVKINDNPALDALNSLHNSIYDNSINSDNSKTNLIYKIRSSIGYGGMIHHYKNYILRQDLSLLELSRFEYSNATRILTDYKKLDINSVEKLAISNIENTLDLYNKKLDTISQLIAKGLSPTEIDNEVKINDRPALFAFKDLTREINIQSNREAEQLNKALSSIVTSGKFVVTITSISILFIIFASYLLIHKYIVNRISSLTKTMNQISKENVSIEIQDTDKQDEIGDMARMLEVFRENIFLRAKAENDLLEANHTLEERVATRTHELENNERRLSSLLETAVDSIITIDSKGIILSFNSAATKMFGYSTDEVAGQNVSLLMPEPHKKEHDHYLQKYHDTNKASIIGKTTDATATRKNGDIFPMELAVSEINNNGEKIYT